MEKEICTISIGGPALEDDYTFYESGKIKRFYDQNQYKLNNEEWIEAKDINDSKKKRLLEKCEEIYKEKISNLLNINIT